MPRFAIIACVHIAIARVNSLIARYAKDVIIRYYIPINTPLPLSLMQSNPRTRRRFDGLIGPTEGWPVFRRYQTPFPRNC